MRLRQKETWLNESQGYKRWAEFVSVDTYDLRNVYNRNEYNIYQ